MKTGRWRVKQYEDTHVQPCWICGKRLTVAESTVDHVIPRSLGGPNAPENYRIACKKCNGKKGSQILKRSGKPRRNWNAAQRGYK